MRPHLCSRRFKREGRSEGSHGAERAWCAGYSSSAERASSYKHTEAAIVKRKAEIFDFASLHASLALDDEMPKRTL